MNCCRNSFNHPKRVLKAINKQIVAGVDNQEEAMSENEDEGYLKALRESGGNYRFFGNKLPICPHCATEYDISRHDHYELYNDDDSHEATCGECNREFRIVTHISYAFSTDEQDE